MKEVFITFLLLEIEYQKDIRDGSFNDFDYNWKQGQIDLLQDIVDDLMGVVKPTMLEFALGFIKEMEQHYAENS